MRASVRQKKVYNMARKSHAVEYPVDMEMDGTEPDSPSDLFELRFCENPECGEPIPVDEPAKFIRLYGRRLKVCKCCFRVHSRE